MDSAALAVESRAVAINRNVESLVIVLVGVGFVGR